MEPDPILDRLRTLDPAAAAGDVDVDGGWERLAGRIRRRDARRRAAFGGVSTLAVAAVAVVSLAGGGASGPEVLRLTPGGAAMGAESAKDAGSGTGGMAAAPAVGMWWTEYRFVAGPDLALPTGTAPGWRLAAGDPRRTVVDLAARLGVVGEPVESYGTWTVGAWPQPSVSAGPDGGWWYSAGDDCTPMGSLEISPSAEVDPSTGGAVVDGGGLRPVEPVPVEPMSDPADSMPAPVDPCAGPDGGVYPVETAVGEARTVWGDGLDGAVIGEAAADATTWSTWVSAPLIIGGVPSDLTVQASFAADGTLQWASGYVGTLEPLGDYPLIGLDAALAGLAGGTATPMWYGGDVAVSEPARGPSGDTGEGDAASTMDGVVPPVPCAPVDPVPLPEVEVVDVILESAALTLSVRWEDGGSLLLLPAYLFTATDGGVWTTLALPAEFLAPADTGPEASDEPVPPAADSSDAGDPHGTPGVDGDGSESSDPWYGGGAAVGCSPGEDGLGVVAPEPGEDPEAPPVIGLPDTSEADQVAADAVGSTLEQVEADAAAAGVVVRVTARDGEQFAATADWRSDRVNVEVTDGVVVSASVG